MKTTFEPSSKYPPSQFKYTCKYKTIEDIISQFNKDDKISPYLENLQEHKNLFDKADTVVIIEGEKLLYAENLNSRSQFKNLVSVIKVSDDDDDNTIECIII